MADIKLLKEYAKSVNIAEELDKDILEKIGNKVMDGYNTDHHSISHWLSDVKKVEELAMMSASKKSYPLPNSANIKHPLITKACYEFSSTTYPEIFKDGKLVKGRVLGLDFNEENQKRAERIADYMNYQLLCESTDWEMEQDKLLNLVALIGFLCKKTYYDPIRKSIKSILCDYKDLIINADAKSMDDARRISHVLHVRRNDLVEGVNAGIYCQEVVEEYLETLKTDELDKEICLIEQHTFLDLDDDNYSEPYIVTIIKESTKVLRIAPRFTKDQMEILDGELVYIDPIQYFTDYHFLVNPKGKFQSVGIGFLMLSLNETINTLLNQLVDAGHLANMQGGYKDARLKVLASGNSLHEPGEWRTVKSEQSMLLKDGLYPINYKEPSETLFKLLSLLIEAGKELSSITDVSTGSASTENAKTGAVQALIAQGQKVHASIQKRIYRSMTSEFKKLYVLNSIYLDPKKYYNIEHDRNVIEQKDFNIKEIDVIPVADPNLSSDAQRSARNQIYMAAQQLPGTNKIKLTELLLRNSNLNVPIEEIMLPPDQAQKPSPEELKLQADIQNMAEVNKMKGHELMLKDKEIQIEFFKVQAQVLELKARSMLELAQAQAQQDNGKFKEYELQLNTLQTQIGAMQHAADFGLDAQKAANEHGLAQQASNQNQQQIDQSGQEGQDAGQDTSVDDTSNQ